MLIDVNSFSTTIALAQDTYVYFGHSSSPQRAIISDIAENFVTYSTYPYYETRRESVKFFRISATKGCQTRLAMLESAKAKWERCEKFAFYNEWMDNERLYLIDILRGIVPSAKTYQRAEQRVRALVSCIGSTIEDPWQDLENRGFSVLGSNLENGFYELWLARKFVTELESLQNYRVVSVEDLP